MTRQSNYIGLIALLIVTVALGTCFTARAQTASAPTTEALLKMENADKAELKRALLATFTRKTLEDGTAWSTQGTSFVFAIRSAKVPLLVVDERAPAVMEDVGDRLYCIFTKVEPAQVLHRFHYLIAGADFGGTNDLAVFGPYATLKKGTLSGKLVGPLVVTSRIYDGVKLRYWIYVPAQYDPRTPIAMMLFQDGHGPIHRDRDHPLLNTLDNLMMEKKLPPLLCIFVDPGEVADTDESPTVAQVKRYAKKWDRTLNQSMRSLLYDTVSDRYSRFLEEELLPEVQAKYNLRKDSYSRAIAGASSGGICSFNVAWQAPYTFSRVLSWVGSFVSLQWQEDPAIRYGGQDFPDLVMRGPKRNLRVWLQDGSHDMEGQPGERLFGSWPVANLRMANALKGADYDFHFSFGVGSHNSAHGAMQLPDSLQWLWRDYDPTKTEQVYTMDPEEKSKPGFRLSIVNRATE